MTRERRLAYIALFVSAVIWGIAPPVIKATLKYLTPVSFLFYRFLLALVIIFPFSIKKIINTKVTKKELLLYLSLGFLCTPLNLLFLFWGINKTTAIDASLISITPPIFVILGGVLFLNETVSKKELSGIILAVAGTLVTIVQPLLEQGVNPSKNIEGNLLVFAGALVWVLFTLLTKKHHQDKLDSLLLVGTSFLVGLIIVFPMFLYERLTLINSLKSTFQPSIPFFLVNPKAVGGIAFMAVFSSIIAYWAYIFGLTKIEASEATVFTYLEPLFAVPIAIIFLKESLTIPFMIGAVLITTGVFICESRPARR